jgi:DNA-binding NarL/FixJ family response regulator
VNMPEDAKGNSGTPIERASGTPLQDVGDPLSRVAELRSSLRESVLDMRSRRHELQQRRGELKAQRQKLRRACDELRGRLSNRAASTIASTSSSPPAPLGSEGILALLSPRQRRVLEGILAGKPNKAIAFDLGVSIKTVETHRARVMEKFDVKSLAELVRMCTLAEMKGYI